MQPVSRPCLAICPRLFVARVLVLCTLTMGDWASHGASPPFAGWTSFGTLDSPSIPEASGLAASRLTPGVLWTHNDAGAIARVYAISTNGNLLSVWNMPTVAGGDFEDIAIGPGPVSGRQYIYLGDIGDNNLERANIRILRVREPEVSLQTAGSPLSFSIFDDVADIVLTYPGGPANAEALMSDPITGDLFIATKFKDIDLSNIYRAPKP